MRKTAWKITVLIMVLMMSGPSAFSASINGWVNIANTNSTTKQDGEKVLSSSSFFRNFSLSLSRPVTPIVSYNLNLRASLKDSESTDYLTDLTTLSYRRNVEPTLELFVSNNVYDLNVGYRRQEQWLTAHYTNEGRLTSEFYYSRFSVVPEKLPSIFINLERQKNFDYLPESGTSDSTDSYSVGSSYTLPSIKMKFGYNLLFSGSTNKTPLNLLSKSVSTGFSNNYYIGYSDSLWNRKINYSAMYRGNYSKGKNTQYYTGTGSEDHIRDNNGAFSVPEDPLDPDPLGQRSLVGEDNPDLWDGNKITSAGISLSDAGNQIGVRIRFVRSVRSIRIYVDEDTVDPDIQLENEGNWEAYMSSTNDINSWTEVVIDAVDVKQDDYFPYNTYYEILFSSSEVAPYFKVINRAISSVPDVDVTEIQAWGTDVITETGDVSAVSTSFTQGISLNAAIRPAQKWDFNLSYSIDRADQEPASVRDSIRGIIKNIFSKSSDNENENSTSIGTKNYGASATWQTHSLLTTIMNINRNEGFNNIGEAENASNSYSLSVNLFPYPTVDTNLTIHRSDRFTDNEKLSTSDALLLSANTKLHRDVNMVTDLGFSRSNDLVDNTTTSLSSIYGSLDARITRKMTGTLDYGYSITDTEGVSSTSKDFSTSLAYQAGRFINLSGNFAYAIFNNKEEIHESISVDWLPLPKIRLNADYEHSDSEGEAFTTKTDSISGYGTIYITRFANIRVAYAYTRTDYGGVSETETHNIMTNLNCRF